MAEIRVEKKPRSGWIWVLVLILILVIAVLAWLFWPAAGTTTPRPATATTTDAASIGAGLAEQTFLAGVEPALQTDLSRRES